VVSTNLLKFKKYINSSASDKYKTSYTSGAIKTIRKEQKIPSELQKRYNPPVLV